LTSTPEIPAARDLSPLRRRLNVLKFAEGIPAGVVARRAGITGAYLSMVADGVRRPSPEVASAIAEALGLHPADLFAAHEPPEA
jgi:transcriptional regulator with XRE-family HTH domain